MNSIIPKGIKYENILGINLDNYEFKDIDVIYF